MEDGLGHGKEDGFQMGAFDGLMFILLRVFLDVGSVEACGTGFEAGW